MQTWILLGVLENRVSMIKVSFWDLLTIGIAVNQGLYWVRSDIAHADT